MLQPTQENLEVHTLNWVITVWDAAKFVERFEKNGYASLGDERYLLALDPYKTVKVSDEEDFELVQRLMV